MTLPSPIASSPLMEVSKQRYLGATYVQEQLILVSDTRVDLLPNNPNRLWWIVQNEGVYDVRMSTDTSISASSGWLLQSGGGVISMSWDDDGDGVGYAVYAISTAPGSKVRVREVIRL